MPIKERRAPKSRTTAGQMVIDGWSGLEPNKPKSAPRQYHELAEQKVLFFLLGRWEKRHPVLEWVHSSLNGLPLTPKVVKDATESGMTSGVWDVFLPAKRKGYCGIYIELKWDDNDLTPNQKRFGRHLRANGYLTAKAYSGIAAARALLDFLDIVDEEIEQDLRMNTKRSTRAEPVYYDDPNCNRIEPNQP